MTFVPSTEKQQGMLAYQLKQAHDGAFENCSLDRHTIEQLCEKHLAEMEEEKAQARLNQYQEAFDRMMGEPMKALDALTIRF